MTGVSTERVTLHDGRSMPVLGLGVYEIEENVADTVFKAIELGYRSIDTAAMYGNEAGVGEAVRRAVSLGIAKREELFITTKVWKCDLGYDQTLAAFDRSMEQLGLDDVDLYLIHWPGSDRQNVETWQALERIRAEGRAKSIGVSNFEPEHLTLIMDQCERKPVVNQVEFNPGRTRRQLHAFCKEHDIQLVAWGPLGKGKFVGHPQLEQIGQKYGKTAAQVILRWDIQSGVVTIPKSSREARMRENADIFDFMLTEEEMALISSLDRT